MGNKIKYPNPNVPSPKFSDEELIEQHSRGHSDIFIANKFNCHRVAVRHRRMKLGLIANFKPFGKKKILTNEELLNRHKERLRKYTIRNNANPKKYKEKSRLSQHKKCIDCGKEIINSSERCCRCNNVFLGKKRFPIKKTREEKLNYWKEYNKTRRKSSPKLQ